MADFKTAYEITMNNEGGYAFDKSDSGGETYCGVARNFHPNWSGWNIIDTAKTSLNFPAVLELNQELSKQVEMFYKYNFWDKIFGDNILDQETAELIFDFAVNAGVSASTVLAQEVVQVDADGLFGIKTLDKINTIKTEYFIPLFTLKKCAYYVNCVKKRSVNQKFFYGWIKRALKL
jgi:lysozyme family protein